MTDAAIKAQKQAARAASLRAKQANLSYRIAKVEGRQQKYTDKANLAARGLRKNWLGKVVPVKGTQTVVGPRQGFWRRLGSKKEVASSYDEPAHVGDSRIEDGATPAPQAEEVNGGLP